MPSESFKVIQQILQANNRVRDGHIQTRGERLEFKIPNGGTQLDEAGDIRTKNIQYTRLVTQGIINWGDARVWLESTDTAQEEVQPIEITVKIGDQIPKGSLVDLTYTNQYNQVITREFLVIGNVAMMSVTEVGRKLTVVPNRKQEVI